MAFIQGILVLALQFLVVTALRNQDQDVVETEEGPTLATFPNLWFGLATAPAHVETVYPGDPWQKWAQDGQVAAYFNAPRKDERLRFLEEPEVEIDLAAKTGIEVFRMGVEWGRLVPQHPTEAGVAGVQDKKALKRYKEICQMVIDRKMKVMMTLFHHALPAWSAAEEGWENENTMVHFRDYAQDVARELADVVDYWVTFNEPHVFVLLSNCAGLWPPGPKKSSFESLQCIAGGGYVKGMNNIQEAHKDFYNWAHEDGSPLTSPRIGVAHNVAHNTAYGFADMPTQYLAEKLFKFGFVDAIKGHLDWMGLNYYGMEMLAGGGVAIVDSEEYSESGRAIHPDGFYETLKQFHNRYGNDDAVKFNSYIITENGVSDGTDIFRPAYIVEHLLALRQAERLGMRIEGYVHWTVSDNWEWADGYCPKFGLVDVNRSDANFSRTPRASYGLFSKIVKEKAISQEQRDDAWELVRQAALRGAMRTFCRADDGQSGLDTPIDRVVSVKDWRFTKLSQTEDGCYVTPWNAVERGVSVGLDGVCNLLPSAPGTNTGTRAVKLKRQERCPSGGEAKKEYRGFICSSLTAPTSYGKTSIENPCCCDPVSGVCAPLLKKSVSHYFKAVLNTRSCPAPLVKEDQQRCASE